MTIEDGRVRCSAGTDRTHLLADLSPSVVDAVRAWVAGGGVPDEVAPDSRAVVEFFTSCGILDNPHPAGPIRWSEVGSTGLEFGPIAAPFDGLVLVRTNGTLADLASACCAAPDTHLVVDLGADHTLSIGPLAHVGFTACGGCYAARLIQRWGDPEPPPRPRLTDYAGLAASLTRLQLDQPTPSGLVNATMSLDLRTGVSQHHRLLRSPACTACGPADIAGDGRLELER